MGEPLLLFGIGATKAGTSWLHRYLAAHPECALRSIKELHFFDTEDKPGRDWFLRELEKKGDSLARQIARDASDDQDDRILHLTEIRLYTHILRRKDEAAFLAYLEELRTDERIVGDITPSYALLPADILSHMSKLKGDVRFVYVMRDPVERLWSHVRMIARRRAKDGNVGAAAGRILDRCLDGREDHIAIRGDYRAALEKLAAAVEPSRIFVCTYEDLFNGDALNRLCAFLGIAAIPGDFETRVHAGARVEMDADQRVRAARFLRPQYDFVASRLGQLPAAWMANMTGAEA